MPFKGFVYCCYDWGPYYINPLLLYREKRYSLCSKRQTNNLAWYVHPQSKSNIEGWSFSEPIEKNYAGDWFSRSGCQWLPDRVTRSPSDRLRSAINHIFISGRDGAFQLTHRRTYYLLPLLPLFAGYGNYFQLSRECYQRKTTVDFNLLFALIALIPAWCNLRTDWDYYLAQITREQTSGSLQFYQAVEVRCFL